MTSALDEVRKLEGEVHELRRKLSTAQEVACELITQARNAERERDKYQNMSADFGNKLKEWQDKTGCSHPTAAQALLKWNGSIGADMLMTTIEKQANRIAEMEAAMLVGKDINQGVSNDF